MRAPEISHTETTVIKSLNMITNIFVQIFTSERIKIDVESKKIGVYLPKGQKAKKAVKLLSHEQIIRTRINIG